MALDAPRCNHLAPLGFKGLKFHLNVDCTATYDIVLIVGIILFFCSLMLLTLLSFFS